MPSMQELCALLGDSLTYANISDESEIYAVYPYDGESVTQRDERALILCEKNDVQHIADSANEMELHLLVCGIADGATACAPLCDKASIAATALSIRKAGSLLLRAMNYYNRAKKTLEAVVAAQGGIHNLLSKAVALTEGEINLYVFSSALTLIDSCTPRSNQGELGLKPDASVSAEQTSLVLDILSGKDTTEHLVTPLVDGDAIAGYLLITCKDTVVVPDMFRSLLAEQILKIPRQSSTVYSSEQKELQKLLTDMLVMIPKDVVPLQERLKNLPHPIQSHMRLLIIAKPPETSAIWRMIPRLKEILPGVNMTVYDGCVVALISGDNFLFRQQLDEERFEALLSDNDAYAIFSIPSKFIRGLRTAYIQAKELLPSLPLLIDADAKHFAYFDDVFHFYRVHLCSVALRSHLGHDKIIYLVHPVAIQLIRHDIAHDTDFFDFIVRYSECGGNIQETALKSHMHRNSAYNKLNKIKDLFNVDFTNGDLQRDMIFSMNIIRYNKMNPQDLIVFKEPATS